MPGPSDQPGPSGQQIPGPSNQDIQDINVVEEIIEIDSDIEFVFEKGHESIPKPKQIKNTNRKRIMGPTCNSKTCMKFKKCSTINVNQRRILYEHFWKTLNWEYKKMFVCSTVSVKKPKNNSVGSRKKSNLRYTFPINKKNVRVCQFMYLNTLGLKESQVRKWLNTESSEIILDNNDSLREEKEQNIIEIDDQDSITEEKKRAIIERHRIYNEEQAKIRMQQRKINKKQIKKKRISEKVNKTALIKLVKENDILYNSEYDRKFIKEKDEIWNRIGQKLNVSAQSCKINWWRLKQLYIHVLRRKKLGIVKNWIYEKEMSFIPFLETRDESGKKTDSKNTDRNDSNDNENEWDTMFEEEKIGIVSKTPMQILVDVGFSTSSTDICVITDDDDDDDDDDDSKDNNPNNNYEIGDDVDIDQIEDIDIKEEPLFR